MALWIGSYAHLAAQITYQSVPDANPGRPTVSTPATLTPVGYLQFETGVQGAWHSAEFSTLLAVNQVTKLTVLPRVELLLASAPAIYTNGGMDTKILPGEVFAGVQGVVLSGHGPHPTISVSYIRRLHASSAPDLDIGTFSQSGILLVSSDVWGFHIDTNGIISEQVEGTARRAQSGQTLCISRAWKRLTISGEMWHFSQPFLDSNAIGNLWAASYAVRRNLIIDTGFNRGLTHSSTRWEAFAGFTYLLPRRLWSKRRAP